MTTMRLPQKRKGSISDQNMFCYILLGVLFSAARKYIDINTFQIIVLGIQSHETNNWTEEYPRMGNTEQFMRCETIVSRKVHR